MACLGERKSTREYGYYIAEERLEQTERQKVVYEARYAREVQVQLLNFIRERDGLPLLEEGEYRAWHKGKRKR